MLEVKILEAEPVASVVEDYVALKGGSESTVTAEDIESALGYTPVSEEYVNEVKDDLATKLDKPSTAPAVGKILKVTAVNEDGSFVCEWADAPSGGGAVNDVQVNRTSIVTDGVANIPVGSYGNAGLVMINQVVDEGISESISGLRIRNGKINIMPASTLLIDGRRGGYYSPIVPSNLDYAVKKAMTDGIGAAWTEDEQTAARARMGLDGYELIVDVQTLETASNFHITSDSNGNALALKAVAIDFAGAADGGTCLIEINNGYLKFIASLGQGRFGSFVGIPLGNDYYCYCFTNSAPDRNQPNGNANNFVAGIKTGTTINDIWFRGTVPAGASIQIYGIRK